ncbi:GNAT family N-acetyltransferase [Peribacillus sp. SCS-37]|uniref:GNAT family N-acetyltransferase n=1 Tax=Paraperibacillus esterisolvens TaxID=3115296 RepID=UPI0039060F83
MLLPLEHRDKETAQQILEVQRPAYEVEANLIGFWDIPPLKDNVETIMNTNEVFLGHMEGTSLAGFISFKESREEVDIHRLVVHPRFFKRGIGKRLLTALIKRAGGRVIKVSTGAENMPALALYKNQGFTVAHVREVVPGLTLAFLEKW